MTPGAAEAAAPRRLDSQPVPRLHTERHLGRDAPRAATPREDVATRRPRFTAGESIRRDAAALAEERHLGRREELDLAYDPVAPAVAPAAPRAAPHRLAPDAQRVVGLEDLDGRRHRVGHVRVNGRRARSPGSRAGSARDRLVARVRAPG